MDMEDKIRPRHSSSLIYYVLLVLTAAAVGIYVFVKKPPIDIQVVNAVVYAFIFYGLFKIADYFFNTLYIEKAKIAVPKLIHDIVTAIIYSVALFAILKIQFGIDLTPIITTSAVFSMVIGLALQDTLTNLIAGVVLHIENPFRINDWVRIKDTDGKVVEINWRTTKLLTRENDYLVIPNGNIIKDTILSVNYPSTEQIMSLFVGVDYDTPPNKVKQVIESVCLKTYTEKMPPPEVRLVKYNDSSIEYEIRVWINDYGLKHHIANIIMTKLWYAFKRENIRIPFPIRDVYCHPVNTVDSNGEFEQKYSAIKRIEFFSVFTEDVQREIASLLAQKHYGRGESIFEEGDEGDSFYVIRRGRVSVTVAGNEVAVLKRGDFFGEISLFTGGIRTASVTAKEDALILVLNKEGFSKVIMDNPSAVESISSIITRREIENEQLAQKISAQALSEEQLNAQFASKKSKMFNKIKAFFNLS
ncbi:mechanosensitive ion channel protein MscS [Candidatus Magnetominusculus xianensis]|uniref:Mechanosensitive ion channel protein MscS n=2 Tax=Candidatus Magnetominusculus xianensis TaxID=1748249 RepID=A0ABR5SB05_9BACT|nr:mechanosensitive ion channel protein MscS [Candidatus Magnetominusculus xianensis]